MKHYKTISQVWKDLDRGITIHWKNENYKVFKEKVKIDSEFQMNHPTKRKRQILSIRCIDNYFGSIMEPSEIRNLFSIKKASKQ